MTSFQRSRAPNRARALKSSTFGRVREPALCGGRQACIMSILLDAPYKVALSEISLGARIFVVAAKNSNKL